MSWTQYINFLIMFPFLLPVVKRWTFLSATPKISINVNAKAETLKPHIPSMNFPVRSRSWGNTEYKRKVMMRQRMEIEMQLGYKYFSTMSTYKKIIIN